ncbi:MAG: 3-phosphoshikimate 1-carboxyvinyltransferase [Syntrophales bacterium]
MNTVEIKTVKGLDAVVEVPGSKSYTQRALAIASLAKGESRLRNVLLSRDTAYLADALRALGARIEIAGKDIYITGTGGKIANPGRTLYLGNNGTAIRFLSSLVSLGKGEFVLSGDRRLCERPVGPLLDALKMLGVDARAEKGDGCPPVVVAARGIRGGPVILTDIESSQFISSLLISAPYAENEVEIALRGKAVSLPYIEMTLDVMAAFGAEVTRSSPASFIVHNRRQYTGRDYIIEGDISSASYFFLAAALCRGRVRVLNVNPYTRQGDIGVLRIMERFGCSVVAADSWIEVSGGEIKDGEVVLDMRDMPDMVPTLSVLASFRKGKTVIRGAAHLRHKESNRIETVARELRRIGAHAEETPDGLVISGGSLRGCEIETYDDHRIAMSFAIAGLAVAGIRIRDGQCVNKSFPGFWDELEKLY